MHRISEIMGKPIVSAESGDKLGSVSDILLESAPIRLVGVVVSGGLLGKQHVLPFADVQTLGGDTVVARSHTRLMSPRQWREAGVQALRSSDIKGKAVITAAGHRLGIVSDLVVDDQNGTVDALEIAARDFAGLLTKRSMLRSLKDIRLGPDAIVVPEATVDQIGPTEADDEMDHT